MTEIKNLNLSDVYITVSWDTSVSHTLKYILLKSGESTQIDYGVSTVLLWVYDRDKSDVLWKGHIPLGGKHPIMINSNYVTYDGQVLPYLERKEIPTNCNKTYIIILLLLCLVLFVIIYNCSSE